MPELLEAQANLDIQDALSRVDDLGSAIEDRLTTALGSFSDLFANVVADIPPVDIEADTSAVAPEIESAIAEGGSGALLEIPVDSSTIVGEIDSAVAGANPEPVVIDADTSDAVAAIDDLGNAAGGGGGGGGGASGEVRGLGDSVQFLEGAAVAGTGKLGGLKGVTEGMGTSAIAGYGGIAVLAGGIVELAHVGIEAASAEDRVTVAFGDQAKAVKEIDIGGLRGEMGTLASQVGSTNAQLDNSIARLGQYGKVAGLSKEQTVQFTQETVALALRATALNPSLGSVDEVVQRLGRGLATGGRFATQFYLSLNRPDIVTHAIELFGGTADSMNKTKLAAAGADLAVHGLGDNLGKDFTTGAASADNQARSVTAGLKNMIEEIAKPLVAPFLEVLKEGVPVARDFGVSIAAIGSVALPILKFLGPAIEPAVAAFVAFKVATVFLPAATAAVKALGVATGLTAAESSSAAAVNAFFVKGLQIETENATLAAAGIKTLGVSTSTLGAEAAIGADGVLVLGAASAEATPEIIALDVAMDTNPIGIFAAVIGAAAVALGVFGGGTEEVKTDLDKLGQQSDATFKKMAESMAAFYAVASKKGGILGDLASTTVQTALKDFRSLADQDTEAAQRYGQALLDAGVISEGQFTSGLNHGIKVQQDHAHAATENAAATAKLTQIQQAATFATDLETAAVDRSSNIHKNAISIAETLTAVGYKNVDAVRAQANAYATASQNATDYKASLDLLNTGTLSLAEAETSQRQAQFDLNKQLKDTAGNIDQTTEAGLKNYSSIEQTTRSVQAYNVALVGNGQQEIATANLNTYTAALVAELQSLNVAPPAITDMLNKLGLTGSVADPATRAILGLAAATGTDLPAAGQTGTDLFGQKIGEIPGKTGDALGSTSLKVGGWDFSTLMLDTGGNAGYNLIIGFVNSIDTYGYQAEDAAGRLASGIRGRFKISSPSKVFQEIGQFAAQGLLGGLVGDLDAGHDSVVAAAERITRAAALNLPGPASGASPIGIGGRAGPGSIIVEKIEVQVIGVSDPAAAYAAGQAAGEGVRAGLDGSQRRQIATAVKTG